MSKKEKNQTGGKKFKKRYVVIPIVFVVIGIFIISNMLRPESPLMVSTEEAAVTDLEETLDISGFIQSNVTKSYFAEANALIQECNVTEGQEVRKGDVLIRYDAAELENQYKQAALQSQASGYGYEDSVSQGKENQQKKADAFKEIANLEARVQEKKNEIVLTQDQINQKNEELLDQQEKDAYEQQKNTFEGADDLNSATTSKEVRSINQALTELNSQLLKKQEELAELQTNLSKQEGIKEQADAGILSESQRMQMDANDQISKLTADSAKAQLEKAQAGVTAEFDGIVTEVQSVAGAYAAQGMSMFTLKSNTDMKLAVSVTKYDLEKIQLGQPAAITFAGKSYMGSVTKMENSAQVNASGTPVINMEIKIENPDDKMYIGMEAKATILIAKRQSVVTIPVEAVNTGKDGDFCYILENGIIRKRKITVGISSDELTEVTDGIQVGDKVITNVTENMKDGAAAAETP